MLLAPEVCVCLYEACTIIRMYRYIVHVHVCVKYMYMYIHVFELCGMPFAIMHYTLTACNKGGVSEVEDTVQPPLL